MCQAIPRRVVQAERARAEVVIDGVPAWVSTIGLPDLTPGEYIVVYAGAAIERIPEADALEMLSFLEAMESMFQGEEGSVFLSERAS